MPNHCCNTLVMSKTTLPVILKNYIRKNEKGENIFDFERIVPIGECPDWHDKRLTLWGTKWVGYDAVRVSAHVEYSYRQTERSDV